jgi:hypothetical protein
MNWQNMSQAELDHEFNRGSTAPAKTEPVRAVPSDNYAELAKTLHVPAIRITYEVSGTEPLHPDPMITARMREIALSDCEYGCKIYADPRSNVRVLAHNRTYGCKK